VNVTPTALPEVVCIEPRVYPDARGAFFEVWRAEHYASLLGGRSFVQDSISISGRGVIRGLHFQHPHAQGKLVMVLAGAVLDVALDVRRGSPTFGRSVRQELSADNHLQLWIPPGFAHGFQALRDQTVFLYKMTDRYSPETERVVHHADPALGIEWPLPPAAVAPKDLAAPRLADVPAEHLPAFE
jgi:dTDP-4-dehydrorhamnose 3,5-epimerase